ncbi:hypothetical protein EZS27_000872 [termite gut metagenome]|uniref:Uncharacterized protein n=1 Tax=termite gut metagenome TaxID=433724 RepID=A0A5J4T0F7_9ZZZZ
MCDANIQQCDENMLKSTLKVSFVNIYYNYPYSINNNYKYNHL